MSEFDNYTLAIGIRSKICKSEKFSGIKMPKAKKHIKNLKKHQIYGFGIKNVVQAVFFFDDFYLKMMVNLRFWIKTISKASKKL
jgi:hypothetical protein